MSILFIVKYCILTCVLQVYRKAKIESALRIGSQAFLKPFVTIATLFW